MLLLKNSLYIWHVRWKEYVSHQDFFWRMLSLEEKKRALQLLSEIHKQKFIVTRGLLRVLIGYLLNQAPAAVKFTYTAAQKPQVVNTKGLEFNVSHTKNNVLYGFCLDIKIGLDIEDKARKMDIERLASHYFSIQENARLAPLADRLKFEAFLKGWCQKEAISKAYGLGLQMRLSQIEVNLAKGEPHLIKMHNSALQHLQFLLYPISVAKNCYAVVAAQTNKKILKIFYSSPIEPWLLCKMISTV